jgi:hypothetical protein
MCCALLGAGTVVGAVAGLGLRPRRPMRSAIVATLGWPVALGTFALGAPLPLVSAMCLAGGFGIALFDVWWLTALSERIPPHALSRVSSYDWMGSLALLPLGYLTAGTIATAVGPKTVAAVGAGIGLAALLIALSSRDIRTLEAAGARQAAPSA